MRILFLMNTFPPGYTGGAEVSAYHTCQGLMREGINCSALVINNRIRPATDEWYELDGISIHRVNFNTHWRPAWRDVFDWRVYQVVRAELSRLKPDLVHIHNVAGSTLAAYVACRVMKVPVVNTLHDLWLLCPNGFLYRCDGSSCVPTPNAAACKMCFRRYDFWGNVPYRRAIFAALTSNVRVFISPSQALINLHLQAGYAAHRFRLIPYGFDERIMVNLPHPSLHESINLAGSRRTVVYAGGGIETKGAQIFVQAIPMMLSKIEQLKIIIAGGGEQRFLSQFRHYAPAVQLLGPVPFKEMRALFRATDLTIVPSIWSENSPVVIYENFQAGTPVVGSAIGGIPELISEGETGYLFPVGDATALAEKVYYHFTRPAHERRRMRQRCIEEVRTHLTLEKHLSGVQQVYQEVLGG